MAITKIDFPTASTPSYTPDIEDDYNNQNEYIERNARGYNAISLTNWDTTTTAPEIAAGSVIEINGSTWDITTDTAIVTTGASSGTVYVVFDDATPEFKLTNTAPTWSETLNGWYTSGDRATGHVMAWDGSTSYTYKRFINYDRRVLVKEVTGTTDAAGNISVAHGVSSGNSNIISVNGYVFFSSTWLSTGNTGFNANYDNTNLYINSSSTYATIPARFVVTYLI